MPFILHKSCQNGNIARSAIILKFDALFTDHIDWPLLTTHWRDLLQMALSIRVG
jgi:hypothetical protein